MHSVWSDQLDPSPHFVPGPGNHVVDGMAEWLVAGTLGSDSLGLYLSSALYWLRDPRRVTTSLNLLFVCKVGI